MKMELVVAIGCLGMLLVGCCTTSTTGEKTCNQSGWPYYGQVVNDKCQCTNQMCGRTPCLSKSKCCAAFGNISAMTNAEDYSSADDNEDVDYSEFSQYPAYRVSYK